MFGKKIRISALHFYLSVVAGAGTTETLPIAVLASGLVRTNPGLGNENALPLDEVVNYSRFKDPD